MHVDHPETRKVQHALWKELPVSRNHAEVWRPAAQRLSDFWIAKTRRLKHGQPVLNRCHLDWRVSDLVSTAAWPIRLRDDADDVVRRPNERLERGHGKLRRAEKHHAHSLPLARARELLDFAHDEVLLQASESIDEERAVEMIHLVLEAPGEEASGLNGLFFAVAVQPLEDSS